MIWPGPGKLGERGDFLLLSFIRSVLLYLVLVLGVRLMGKRQIGQMEASEFVVTMLVADLAAIPMQDGAIPLLTGLVPMLTVMGLELALSWIILKSLLIRRLFCGRPVILIDNGKLLQENLRCTRISLEELISHLRQKDVADIREVQFAILETDGNLSVFPYPETRPAAARDAGISVQKQDIPLVLIADGQLSRENLWKAGKEEAWLEQVLREQRGEVRTTLLLTVDREGRTFYVAKEENS